MVVLNPRSGGGKVARFDLVQRAQEMGARISLIGPGADGGTLASQAVEEGADVVAVAGGDGTVSAVAAVAAQSGRPMVVVPAGTRNHFARDLGLDIRSPAAALRALVDGERKRIDIAAVGSRVFLNNVSFGVYAEALLVPDYRQSKARAFASVIGPYMQGLEFADASVETPVGTIERPGVVLISNNPYHLSTLRYLGYRFGLDRGVLGAIVLPKPPGRSADPVSHWRAQIRGMTRTGALPPGVIAWSSEQVTLHGTGQDLAAGMDGEAVRLPLPVVCDIRAAALQVLLPRDRPGVRAEPTGPPR